MVFRPEGQNSPYLGRGFILGLTCYDMGHTMTKYKLRISQRRKAGQWEIQN